MSDRPEIEIQRQIAFGDDGQLEVTETSVETSLEDFGADVDHRDRDSRRDAPNRANSASTVGPKLSKHPREISRRSSLIRTKTSRPSLATMRPLAVSSKNN
jgi:hypothetical protein